MRNEKIAVFPVDEDFLSLPDNQNIELGKECYKISYYITLAGWNVDGVERQLHTLDEFDFKNISVVKWIFDFSIYNVYYVGFGFLAKTIMNIFL